MEAFSALLAICAGNSPVPGEFPTQRPVTRSFDVYFDLRLNKRLCKQSWGWWFETLLCPLWRHSNVFHKSNVILKESFWCQYRRRDPNWNTACIKWYYSLNTCIVSCQYCHSAVLLINLLYDPKFWQLLSTYNYAHRSHFLSHLSPHFG